MSETEIPDWWYMLLHPRPVYLVVSAHSDKRGVMAASWIMPIAEEPPRVAWAASKDSYTLHIVKNSREFTINVVTDEMLEAVWRAGTTSGWKVKDKLSSIGISIESSRKVGVPRINNAAGVLECRVWQMIDVGETELVIGDVVDAYVLRRDLFNTRYGWIIPKSRILLHASGRAFSVPGRLLLPGRTT